MSSNKPFKTVFAGVIAALTVSLTVTGCSTSNADLASQGPDTVTNRVSQLIQDGDGEGLCEAVNSLAASKICNQLFSSKGIAEFQVPKPENFGFEWKYRFYVDGLSIEYIATEDPEHEGKWHYRQVQLSSPTFSLPYGGKLGSEILVGGVSYNVLPGGFKESVTINQDSEGLTEVSADEFGGFKTTRTVTGTEYIKAKSLEACNFELKNLKPEFSNLLVDFMFGAKRKSVTPKSDLKTDKPCELSSLDENGLSASYTYTVSFTGTGKPGPFGEISGRWTMTRNGLISFKIDNSGKLISEPTIVRAVEDEVWQ